MTTPKLDATSHWWVSALVQFNFKLEYQKGCDNTVVNALSQVTTWLDLDTVKSILDRVALGSVHQSKAHDPAVVKGDHCLEQEVHVIAGQVLVQMHVTDWVAAKKEDLMLSAVLDWLKHRRRQIWSHFWQNTPPVKKSSWSYRISRTLQFMREPYTCAQHQKVKLKTFYSL